MFPAEKITRRDFLRKLSLLGLGLGGLLAPGGCSYPHPTPTEAPPKGELHQARYYRTVPGGTVQCQLCFRRCIIAKGDRGFCRNRENWSGKLYTLVYGKPCAIVIDPIELEPVFHMWPGHRNYALATASCNFRCKFCHNWHISQRSVEETENYARTPEEIVEEALEKKCKSISCTMNEPAVFYEYMYDIARCAKASGLGMLFHTNASLAHRPLAELLKFTDAVTVDLKGFTSRFYRHICSSELEPVLATLRYIGAQGAHLEIVNLMVPTLNDDLGDIERMCRWIVDNLGVEVPLHFNRFFPQYRLTNLPPTPVETLESAKAVADRLGLHYVYIGNVPGHRSNSTFCPKCGSILIHRIEYGVLENHLVDGKCKTCGHQVPGIWE